MYRRERSLLFRLAVLLLAAVFLCPLGAAAAEPRASNYLDSYNAYPYAAGGGEVQIWFTVTADDYMDDIGSLSVEIYWSETDSEDDDDWEFATSYNNGNTPSMLGHDKYYYSSHVDYEEAVPGRYYKAYVCIYAGNNNVGDTRYFWTGSVKAT